MLAGIVCSILPDIDIVGFRYGVRYGDVLGHRGLTHGLPFAAILAGVLAVLVPRAAERSGLFSIWLFLFFATASHGILDAFTNGGLGVGFFAPFSNRRYFFPLRPIQVSPIDASRFFSAEGWAVLRSELRWVWAPSVLFGAGAILVRSVTTTRTQPREKRT